MDRVISVVGLGYVGLPVAVAFGKAKKVIGFDINAKRIEELKKGYDRTGEISSKSFNHLDIIFTQNIEDLRQANFHIVTVPTPVDAATQPDLTPVLRASERVGKILKKRDIVVYESTVYPGVTEEVCVPILEQFSNLKCGEDFSVGYSPERINPGDKDRTFTKIQKVVSGSDRETLDIVASVYEAVVTAGVYRATSIKVAEAAKVIENTQRDLNIALMNELAIIFDHLGVDTSEVLAVARTKWNFLDFKPGLVGGHCIGVDPYYLTHKAEKIGYIPQVILAGRRINDGMGKYIAQRTVKEMILAGHHHIFGSTVTIFGLTFKENCPDLRNSKVVDIIQEFRDYGVHVQICDPLANPEEARQEYGVSLIAFDRLDPAAAIVAAVAHDAFKRLTVPELLPLMNQHPVLMDIKGIYEREPLEKAGVRVWRL